MNVFCVCMISGFLALITSGCITNKPLPPSLHTKARSAGGIKVLSVDPLHDNAGLLVHGRVERMLGYPDSPYRHLDLEVVGSTGNILSHQAIDFFPNPIPFSRFGPGRSSYTARLQDIPPPGSTILVAVDCARRADCKPASNIQ